MVLGGPRPRAVLARLLLDTGRVVPVDALIDDVWNGRPPATAAKTLQKYVSELRKAIGDPPLRTRGRGYSVEGGTLDAKEFEVLVVQAQAALARGDAGEADRVADQAHALWRGDVLADLPEARFAEPERTRLGELRLLALEVRYGAELELGNAGAAAAALAEVVEAHPLREALWALYLRALYASGRQADALRAFDRHRRLLAEELGIEPSPELRRLEAAILRQELDVPATPRPGVGNLPHALSSFVGRARVLDVVAAALVDHRLVTLTGTGGVGKTRLALELMRRGTPGHPGGAWLVDLAAVVDGAGVVRAVADALGVEEQPGQDLTDTLVAVLGHRRPTLLLLDNCEHVANECAALARTILARCPRVRMMATSRVPLGVEGECVRPVPSLADDEAVTLFLDRARLAGAGIPLTADDRPTVEEICRRLDGLPLAIELAASQLRVLAPAEVAARLDDRFSLLSSPRSAASRGRTLLATVQSSYDLLCDGAQRVFERLGAFAGSFSLEAAEAVCSGRGIGARDVLGHLTELVDHSLVMREAGAWSAARYRLLDTLRLFARQRLEAAGGLEATSRAHALFLLGLADRAAPHFYAPDEVVWRGRLQAEDHNLRTALDWAARHDPVVAHRLAVALWRYWDVRWQERYATALFERLLGDHASGVPDDLRAWALTAAADLASNTGEGRRAATWADEAVETFRRLGNSFGLAHAQLARGSALGNRGSLDKADLVLYAALATARGLDDERVQARALQLLGFVAVRRGELDRATSHHRAELAVWEKAGSIRGRSTALRRLAAIERDRRDLIVAESLCRDALSCMEQLDDAAGVAHVRLTLADLARLRGDEAQAESLYLQGFEEVRAIGDRRCIASTFKNLATMASDKGDFVRASSLLVDSMSVRHDLGDDAGLAECLEGLGTIAAAVGADTEGVTLLAAADARRTSTGAFAPPAERRVVDALLDSLRSRMEPDDVARAMQEGRSLSPADAVGYSRTVMQKVVGQAPG